MITTATSLSEAIQALEVNVQDCKDIVVDLRFLKFSSDDEEQSLTDTATGAKYLFKNFDDPKDPVKSHALRQLCKLSGVPYNFFHENRPPVRESIVGNWLKSKAPKEGDETLILLKVREGQGLNIIRAILPVESVTIPYADVLKALVNYPQDVTVSLDYVVGTDRDELQMHARLVYEEELEGSEYYPGLAITVSDLGASDLIIDLYLMHKESKACMAAQYGGQPFAKVQFAKVQPAEILEMLSSVPCRLKDEFINFLQALTDTEGSYPGVERACVLVSSKKNVPKNFKRAIHLEASECFEDMASLRDFLRHAGVVAKAYGYSDRMKIERAAGSFGGLAYGKK
jgi:hypothetical protein